MGRPGFNHAGAFLDGTGLEDRVMRCTLPGWLVAIALWAALASAAGVADAADADTETEAASPVEVRDTRSGKVLTTFPGHNGRVSLAFVPDSRFLLTGDSTLLRLWGVP